LLTQELEQLLGRTKSQLLAGIDFLYPAFKLVLGWLTRIAELNHKSTAHSEIRIWFEKNSGVTYGWRFDAISVTLRCDEKWDELAN